MTHPAKTPPSPPEQTTTVGLFAAFTALAIAALLALAPAASADFSFGSFGVGAGQLSEFPEGIAASRQSGDVYVADANNQRVSQFDASGNFVRAFGWGVATGAAELQSCTTTCRRGLEAAGAGAFTYPEAVAVDNEASSESYGDLYVIDANNRRVEKFGPSGEFLLAFGWGVATGAAELQTCGPEASPPTATCRAGLGGTGLGQFEWRSPRVPSIAIGPAGTIYLGDNVNRIQKFAPNGSYVGDLELPVPAVGEVDAASALAVNTVGDIYVRRCIRHCGVSEPEYAQGVEEYKPNGELIRTLDASGMPEQLAVTSADDLLVGDSAGGYEFLEYDPGGVLLAEFTSDEIVIGPEELNSGTAKGAVEGVAVSAVDTGLYVSNSYSVFFGGSSELFSHVVAVGIPQPGPPTIAPGSEQATAVEPETATLNAVANARGHEAEVHFEYVSRHDFETEGGFNSPHTVSTPAHGIGLLIKDQPIAAGISGLQMNTTYRFRAVIASHCNEAEPAEVCEAKGEAADFTTLPPISVRDFTTQTVGPELVTFKAELSPNNGTGTEYTIRYGEDESYGGGSVHGRLAQAIVGNEFEQVTATFEHLRPNTRYHYQLSAENSYGEEVTTADQTFTTEETIAELDAAQGCENAQLREENNSLALPECRAYERVSPQEKGGYAVTTHVQKFDLLAPSGERAAFSSTGAFAGAGESHILIDYVSQRTESGWVTNAAGIPATPTVQPIGPYDFTAELDGWLDPASNAPQWSEGEYSPASGRLYLGRPGGIFAPASPTFHRVDGVPITSTAEYEVKGQSADLSRLFIFTGAPLLAADTLPANPGLFANQGTRIYEVAGATGPSPTLRLRVQIAPAFALGGGNCEFDGQMGQPMNATSTDGSTLFFDAPLEEHPGQPCFNVPDPNPAPLYALIGEAAPIPISKEPLPSECHSPAPCSTAAPQNAHFYGATPSGSQAWFTTEQPLVDADSEENEDLYLAKLENGAVKELIEASAGDNTDPHPGTGAGLKGVVQVSADGNRAYFVATGLLTTHENALHQSAAQGADNLYEYDSQSGETQFVARLCSGPERSGTLADPACGANLNAANRQLNDSRLWSPNEGRQAQPTPDGRYLLFSTYAQLIGSGPEADTDTASDVYRYDTVTGRIVRVSTGRNGNDGNGNDSSFNDLIASPGWTKEERQLQELASDDSRAISSDGSTVVFSTRAPLSSHDTNGAYDVYEWREGQVSLVSDGLDPHGALTTEGSPGSIARIDSTGRNILFLSDRGLVPSDTDGVADVYDARVEGGFPSPPAPETPCQSGETCLGPTPPAPTPPNVTTGHNESGGNGPQQLHCAKGRHRVSKHGQARCVPNRHRKHHKRTAGHKQGGGK